MGFGGFSTHEKNRILETIPGNFKCNMADGKDSSGTPIRKVERLHNKLWNTNTRSKHLVSSERLQNTIFNISSKTERSNGDLRNLGNVEKECSSQNAATAVTWSS